MARLSRLSLDQVIAMRRLYETSSETIPRIAQQIGVSPATILKRARSEGWRPRRVPKPAHDTTLRHIGKQCTGLALCPERVALVARAWAAAHTQINEIETRALIRERDKDGGSPRASDDARAVALLVRTMKDLTGLDAIKWGEQTAQAKGAPHDSTGPAGLATLADELVRRLAGLRKGRASARASGGA
jgi:hypothetical protein